MPTQLTSGKVMYSDKDAFGDILLNGVSVLDNEPIEVILSETGLDAVCLRKQIGSEASAVTTLIDGQVKNYTYYGSVTVVPLRGFDDGFSQGFRK